MVITAGSFTSMVSSPPSTSRVIFALSASSLSFEAKVACGQPSSAASIWPVWLQSSSIACLPRMTSRGASLAMMALRSFATASGSSTWSVRTWMPRSAPMASAVRIVSWHCAGPMETATISVAVPASLRRIASSTAISSKGFIDILTLAVSTPVLSAFTRILTLKSMTRLTATSTFIGAIGDVRVRTRKVGGMLHPHNAKASLSSPKRGRSAAAQYRARGPPDA